LNIIHGAWEIVLNRRQTDPKYALPKRLELNPRGVWPYSANSYVSTLYTGIEYHYLPKLIVLGLERSCTGQETEFPHPVEPLTTLPLRETPVAVKVSERGFFLNLLATSSIIKSGSIPNGKVGP
jgi:hypothetical protein